MDQEFHDMRIQMQQRIRNWLEKRNIASTPEWHQRLPDIARRVEASIYKDCATKEDYAKNFQSPIENRLAGIMKGLQHHHQQLQHQQQLQQQMQQQQVQQQQMTQQQVQQQQVQQQQMTQLTHHHHHNFASNSSASGMMIPTPGMMHGNNINNSMTGNVRMSNLMESNSGGMNSLAGNTGGEFKGVHEKETRIGYDFISSSSSMSSSASPKERGRFACTGGCNDELDLDLHL